MNDRNTLDESIILALIILKTVPELLMIMKNNNIMKNEEYLNIELNLI